MFAWFRNDTMQYCCNTLYNTQALREIGGLNSRHNLFQDALAQVKVAATHGHAHVAGVKASWRRHGGNAGSAARASLDSWCDDSLELIEAVCELEPQRAPELREAGMRFLCAMNYRPPHRSLHQSHGHSPTCVLPATSDMRRRRFPASIAQS